MTEQVIDIRDRIEKMRTQMTGSPTGLKQKENIQYVNEKNAFQNKSILKKSEVPTKSNLPMNGASNLRRVRKKRMKNLKRSTGFLVLMQKKIKLVQKLIKIIRMKILSMIKNNLLN